MGDLSRRIDGVMRVVNALSFAFIVAVFSYPMVVVGELGPQAIGLKEGTSYFYTTPLFIGAILLLFVVRRVSFLPLKSVFAKGGHATSPEKVIGAYFVSVIIGLVLREAVAIVGMILSLMEHRLFWCVVLGLASFISIAQNWPKRADLETLLQNASASAGS